MQKRTSVIFQIRHHNPIRLEKKKEKEKRKVKENERVPPRAELHQEAIIKVTTIHSPLLNRVFI